VAASVIAAAAVGVLRDTGFRIEQRDGDLHVSRGLLSTRSSVLPLRRVQLVLVQRNWARRLLGFAVVRVYSAGGSGGGERRVTVPLLPDGEVESLLPELYPGATGTPPLSAHPRNALRRAVFRWVRSTAVVVAAIWIVPVGLLEPIQLPSLSLLLFAVVLGVVEYRQLAHGLDDELVAARRGALSITTSLAPLTKIQAVTTAANPFQRRLGLATVTAHVAGPGGDVEVLDMGAEEAVGLHDRLVEHAADPATTDLSAGAIAPETAVGR
jgi:putative membrane protein